MKICYSFVPEDLRYTSYASPVWWGCGVTSSSTGRTSVTDYLESGFTVVQNFPHNDVGFDAARYGEAIYLSGEPDPQDPPILMGHRSVYKSTNFSEALRRGEIVLNPYSVSAIVASPIYNRTIVDEGPCTAWGNRQLSLRTQGRLPSAPSPCNLYSLYEGQICNAIVHYRRRHGTLKLTDSPFLYVTEQNIRSVFETYTNTLDNMSLVQETVAKLNARSVDFLTSVMELPETIISIGKILVGVRRIIQSAISRKSRLEIRHARNVERNRIDLDVARSNINRVTSALNGRVTKEQRRILKLQLKKYRRLVRELERRGRNLAVQLTTELSNLWMSFRYEVMPNVYLCQDLAKSPNNLTNVFQTERGRVRTEGWIPQFPGFEASGSVTTTWRFMAKYCYNLNTSQALMDIRKAFSANPFVTVHELFPMSFVLDWFFSVGDMLQARFGKPSLAVAQGFYLTQKNELDLRYTHVETGSAFTVKGENYSSQIVNVEEFLGIFPLINLNWMRLVDSSAIIWGQLKRHFKLK